MTRSGLIFDDRYRLNERIAAGGVGQVWHGRDLLLARPVAIKVLRPEYADHPETLDRFRKEARHAGSLSHPNIAQVYDYGHDRKAGSPYLVMELVDGPSLADVLAAGPVDPAFALDVVAQAAAGLSAAHRAGLVHRDIKPGNILVGADGRVRVTDFGIAHAAGQAPVTGPGLVMGTTQYMAPERIAGAQGTAASDLYALGIVLYECLTGVPPYAGGPAEVMAAHLYAPLPPLPPGIPPEFVALVDRLTVKDPAKRMSDARDLTGQAARLRDTVAVGGLVLSARQAPYSADLPLPQWDDGGPTPPRGTSPPTSPARSRLAAATGAPPTAGVPVAGNDLAARDRRRRAGVYAASAVLLVGAGVAGLLVSGALRAAPAADRTVVGTSATGLPAGGARPSGSGSAPADGTGANTGAGVGRSVGTSAATPGASARASGSAGAASPGVTRPGATPSAQPSATLPVQPTTGPGAGASAGAGGGGASQSPGPSTTPVASSSPTSGDGSPSGSPSGTPATTPSDTSSPTPSSPAASTPPPVACVLGICL